MTTKPRSISKVSEGIPVLKMPPEMALPALRILAAERDAERRRAQLSELRPTIPPRTLLNAYVLPSLTSLKLFDGRLRGGSVSRYGRAIAAEATDDGAKVLMARHLLQMDAERVGLVDWLTERSIHGERKVVALKRFLSQTARDGESPTQDRLGKWANFLVFFGVIREHHTNGALTWAVSPRHIAALQNDRQTEQALSDDLKADAILDAYTRASEQLGTRLYLPISVFRDVLGSLLSARGSGDLPDGQLDDILREAPKLLDRHIVSFSPFSGPARGGLQLTGDEYVGFISIRPRVGKSGASAHEAKPSPKKPRRKGVP